MGASLPHELARLLAASDQATRESAWDAFVSEHSRLLLHVARSVGHDHDPTMDAYAHVLEALRRDEFQRLRTYVPDGRTKFTTWLVVVARRLCLDQQRRRYGRVHGGNEAAQEGRDTRRHLVDLVAADLDPDHVADAAAGPGERLEVREIGAALAEELAALDTRDRLLLRLRFEEGLGARAIAADMGFPTPFHVYRRLNLVLGRLRQALRGRGIDGPGS